MVTVTGQGGRSDVYIYIPTSPYFSGQIHHHSNKFTNLESLARPKLNSTRTREITTCHHLTLPLDPPCSCEADNLALQVFGSGSNSLQSSLFPTSAVSIQDISEIHSHIHLIEVIMMILAFVHMPLFDMIVLTFDYRSPRSKNICR